MKEPCTNSPVFGPSKLGSVWGFFSSIGWPFTHNKISDWVYAPFLRYGGAKSPIFTHICRYFIVELRLLQGTGCRYWSAVCGDLSSYFWIIFSHLLQTRKWFFGGGGGGALFILSWPFVYVLLALIASFSTPLHAVIMMVFSVRNLSSSLYLTNSNVVSLFLPF